MKKSNKKILVLTLFLGILVLGKLNNKNTVTIGFAGDVMIGRLVNEIIVKKGYSYPWGNTLPLLKKPDITLINLETTLTAHEQKTPKIFNFKALPDRVKTLQEADIDIVNLANNHILDFGIKGLLQTIETLDNAGIKHVGAGKNLQEAQRPVIITKKNIAIGFIGYTDNEPTWEAVHLRQGYGVTLQEKTKISQEKDYEEQNNVTSSWKASNNKAGTNYIEVGDIEKIKKDITQLKNNVDIVVVTIHWGPNMREKPSQDFINFAHAIIDAGADIIHGHSAHIFQGIEIYNNKVIMYDTGDFVDDYVVDPILRNDQSFFFEINIDKNGPLAVTLTPTIIKDMQVNIAPKNEKANIIKHMQKLSAELGTDVENDGTIQIRK